MNLKAIYENNRRTTGFGTTAGIISSNLAREFKISLFDDLRFGLSFNYLGSLNTDTIYTSLSLFLLDTLALAKTEMTIPARFNAGISFAFAEQYNVNLDYMYQPMSKYTFNNQSDVNLRDINKISAAVEFKPKKQWG